MRPPRREFSAFRGLGYLSSKLRTLVARGSVHESHGHLKARQFNTSGNVPLYSFPRSSFLHTHQLNTATSNASMSSFFRRQDIRSAWLDSKEESLLAELSHISDTDTSSIPKSHLHTHTSKATSSVTRTPSVAMANRSYHFDTTAAGASTSGMCRKTAHRVQLWCDSPHQGVSLVSWDYRGSYP